MVDFLTHLLYWHWFIFAAVLLILELITGSGFLFWIGLSAAVIGCILWFVPELNWAIQFVGFAGLAIIAAVLWRLYLHRYPTKTDKPALNRRGEQYVGRVFTLESDIVNGLGHIRVDDSTWRVQCHHDLLAGEKIKIIGVDGVILLAKKE